MRIISLLLAIVLCLPVHAKDEGEVTLESSKAEISITTSKVARLYGMINEESLKRFQADMQRTAHLPGDRVILINSTGGHLDHGLKMIDLMKQEQAKGVKSICYVEAEAHSMAFNFLTHCSVRLANPRAVSLVHKIAFAVVTSGKKRLTSKTLRELADELDKADERFRQDNATAMGLTLEEYDKYADAETCWSAATLLKRGYLHGLGKLKK